MPHSRSEKECVVPTSRLDIDLSRIERNLRLIRGVISNETEARRLDPSPKGGRGGKVGLCAVVKQDAYGAGAARIAKRLSAAGVEMFSVYTLEEARAVAEAVPTAPILILMPVFGLDRHDPLYRHMSTGRVHLTMHSVDQFNAVSEAAGRIGIALPVHVQVDTGLSRGGLIPEESSDLLERVLSSQKLRLAGMMTHFASPCCDEAFTREQARLFREFVEQVKPAIKNAAGQSMRQGANIQDIALHAANSCATFRSRSLHGSMVRCGQSLLGYLMDDEDVPDEFEFAPQARALQPAIRWTSSLVHVASIPAGWSVGYGSTWRAPHRADGKATKIALVPVGYADGYPRSLGGRGGGGPGVVAITGKLWERKAPSESEKVEHAARGVAFAQVVGRVSMDQITIDVTDVPEEYLKFGSVNGEPTGPEVELYSRDAGAPNFLPRLARAAGSITHELLCRIGARVERLHCYPANSATEVISSNAGAGATTALKLGGIGGAAAVAR